MSSRAIAVIIIGMVIASFAWGMFLIMSSGSSADESLVGLTRTPESIVVMFARCVREPIGRVEVATTTTEDTSRVVFKAQLTDRPLGTSRLDLGVQPGYTTRGTVAPGSSRRLAITRLRNAKGRAMLVAQLEFVPADVPADAVLRADGEIVSNARFDAQKC